MPCPLCDNIHVEKSGYCASCGRAKRKAEQPKKEKSKKPIRKMSKKKMDREKELTKLRKALKEKYPYCMTCGSTQEPIDYSHILPVGMFEEFELHPANALRECRPCHDVWSYGTLAEKKRQPTWNEKRAIILRLKPEYLDQLELKAKS